MKDELAVFLWYRRISARLKTVCEVLKLVVDFWTALYIVVPSLIVLVVLYRELLVGLPAWFTPEWEIFLVLGLAYFMVSGSPRSYLNETDLTFLHPNSQEFQRLFRIGILSSLALNNLVVLLMIIGLFPFYLHLEAVALQVWLGVGLGILILRTAFLQILFLLRARGSRLAFKGLFLLGFMAAWNQLLIPFIHTDQALYEALMLGIALFMLVLAMLLRSFLPINNWAKLVQDEANYDIRFMGQMLGYAAQPVRKRNGASVWSQQRFAIPFDKSSTLTYFYVKYFLRLKLIWQTFMQIGAVCLLVSLSSLSYWAILGFLATADLMLGLLVRSAVVENKEKLDLFTQALDKKDSLKGLRNLYIIVMVPLIVLPVFSGFAGTMNLMQVLGGIIILFVWVLISSQLMLNYSKTYFVLNEI